MKEYLQTTVETKQEDEEHADAIAMDEKEDARLLGSLEALYGCTDPEAIWLSINEKLVDAGLAPKLA
ncbi:hypothetical protein JCM3766R1_002570 [Sporobolomyces carnicolor]